MQLPGRGLSAEGAAGTDAGADAAVDATITIDVDLTLGPVQTEAQGLQPVFCRIQFIDVTGELHHHGAALIGSDLCSQDLGGNIEINGKPIGDRLVNRLAGEVQGQTPFQAPSSGLRGEVSNVRPGTPWPTPSPAGHRHCQSAQMCLDLVRIHPFP